MESYYDFDNEQATARDLANQWLARFAPLISNDEVSLKLKDIRNQLGVVSSLRKDAPQLRSLLEPLTSAADQQLLNTICQAADQLDSIEEPLRKQLATVAPGDPNGMIDVITLQNRLAERQAKQEIGICETTFVPSILEIETSPPNKTVAIGAGIFGLAWTAFTTLHCIAMIGAMYHAFGYAAFGLLFFYSIFFMVGFAMLGSCFNSLCTESISLTGRTLTIVRKLHNWNRTKTYELADDTKASIGKPQTGTTQQSSGTAPLQTINLTDARGKGISFGASTTYEFKQKLAKRINEYFAVWG